MMRRIAGRVLLYALAPALCCTGAVSLSKAAWAEDPEALCREARSLKDSGRLEAAAAAYREAIRLDASSDEAWWGLAWVYRKQGLTQPAVESFRKVLELTTDPERRREAEGALERMGASALRPGAPEVSPKPPSLPPVELSLDAARELVRQDRTTEALRVLRALVAQDVDRDAAERLKREVTRGRRLVRVRAAADPMFRTLPDWEQRVRARFEAAAGEISRQVEVDFALVAVDAWEPTTAAEGMGVVADLQSSVSDAGVDIVVGFVAERRDAPPTGERLEIQGYTLGLAPCFTGTVVVSEVVASRDGVEWRMPEANLRENLAHELGHLFGAVHVTGDSVMRAEPGGAPNFDLDPLNVQVVQACRWVDFREHFASLDRGELERLSEAYEQLAAGPGADDGVHFYRAVALTFLDRYAEAIEEYELVLKTSWRDAYTHLNLGKLYDRVGDASKARTHWGVAATLGKPPEVAEEARRELGRTEG